MHNILVIFNFVDIQLSPIYAGGSKHVHFKTRAFALILTAGSFHFDPYTVQHSLYLPMSVPHKYDSFCSITEEEVEEMSPFLDYQLIKRIYHRSGLGSGLGLAELDWVGLVCHQGCYLLTKAASGSFNFRENGQSRQKETEGNYFESGTLFVRSPAKK